MKPTLQKLSLAIILIFNSIGVFSQSISGFIFNEKTQEPLEGVTVATGPGKGVTSSEGGKFTIKLNEEDKKLIFSYVGFEKRTLLISSLPEKEIKIGLKPLPTGLNQVVVSSGKFQQSRSEVPVSMEVFNEQFVLNNNSLTMDDALNRVSGVNVLRGQVNIRGSSGFSYGVGSRVMMLYDDMPFLTADAGEIRWVMVPLENIEQVEVIKGASSALYGSNALAGLVHFRTASPGLKPRTTITTFNTLYDNPPFPHKRPWGDNSNPIAQGLSVSHSQRIGRLSLVTSMSLINDQGYRIGEKSTRGRFNANLKYQTGIKGLTLGLNMSGMVDSLRLYTFWQNDTMAWAPAPLSVNNQLQYRIMIDPTVTWVPNDHEKHTFRNRFFRNYLSFDEDFEIAWGNMYYSEYQYQHRFSWKWAEKTVVTAGMINQYNQIGSDKLYGERHGTNQAAYVQVDQTIGRLNWNLGGRYEWHNIEQGTRKFDYPVFRSGINYRILRKTWLRATYGEGVRVPSIAELYAKSMIGTNAILPNVDLIAERSWSYEAGIRQEFAKGKFSGNIEASYFHTDYINMIEYRLGVRLSGPQTPTEISFKPNNIVNARIYGAEITTQMGYVFRDGAINISTGYTWLMPYDLSPDFNFYAGLPDTMKNLAQGLVPEDLQRILPYRYNHLVRADFEIKYKKITVGSNMRYNSFMVNIENVYYPISASGLIGRGLLDQRLRGLSGDLIWDFRFYFEPNEHWKIGVIARNAFNRAVMSIPFNMAEQRSVTVQLQCRI